MFKTVNLRADIPASHELRITLPNDIPTGPADVVVVISTSDQKKTPTLRDLADSEFIGIWSDRADAGGDLARRLRQEGWKRSAE